MPGRPAYGPSGPNAVTPTQTMSGFSAATCS